MIANIKLEFKHLQCMEHDNIIKVHELLIDNKMGEIFLVMEYFKGKELFVMLADIGHYDGSIKRGNCENPLQTAFRGNQILA